MSHRDQRRAAHGADLEHHGGDASLARVVQSRPGARIRFTPHSTSDLARTLGLSGPGAGTAEIPVDGLVIESPEGADGPVLALNMAVLGRSPDRLTPWSRRRPVRVEIDGAEVWSGAATSVIAASGEYLRGADLVPRGHPGDGRFEVQVYAVAPSQRRKMRRRLAAGTHLPHPEIRTFSATSLAVSFRRPVRVEIDRERFPRARTFRVRLVPRAATLVF